MSNEPVRRYIYSLLAPIVALLVFYGITTDEAAALWVAVASTVLGIGATEAARARVTPTTRTR
jgi:hypothetical protein